MKDEYTVCLLMKPERARGSHLVMQGRRGAVPRGSLCEGSWLAAAAAAWQWLSVGAECILWISAPLQMHFCKWMLCPETLFCKLWPNNTSFSGLSSQCFEAMWNPHEYFDDFFENYFIKGKTGNCCKQYMHTIITKAHFTQCISTLRINTTNRVSNPHQCYWKELLPKIQLLCQNSLFLS